MGVADAGLGLLDRLQLAASGKGQRAHDHLAAKLGQPVVQRAGGVCAFDGEGFGEQHVAGVQAGIHLHDGDAGLRVARFNGAVNRRGAAPARQQRGVDIQATQPGRVKHPLRQDQPVGGHHHHVGICRFNGLARASGVFRVFAVQPQASGLGNGNGVALRPLLDGRGVQLHAAPGGPVGLGQHQRNVKTGGQQLGQGDTGEFGGTGKNDTHGAGF